MNQRDVLGWGVLAEQRFREIDNGQDISWNAYTRCLVNLLPLGPGTRVLDLGCGTGHLASILAKLGCDVVAVDTSAEMLKIAQRVPLSHQITFIHNDVSNYIASVETQEVNIIVANMLFMSMPHQQLRKLVSGLKTLLSDDGVVGISICDPRRWWYRMRRESTLDVDYTSLGNCKWGQRIQKNPEPKILVDYYHRPWAWYNKLLANARFNIDDIRFLDPNVQNPSGEVDSHQKARYRVLRCK